MSKETVTIPAPAIKDMVEGSGRIKRPRPEPGAQARTDWRGNATEVLTDVPDTLVPADNVDEQIALDEASMREITGAPIETDDVGVFTSHRAHNLDGDASELIAIPHPRCTEWSHRAGLTRSRPRERQSRCAPICRSGRQNECRHRILCTSNTHYTH